MADRREEVSGRSPSKRPKLDHEEPFSNICSSNGEPAGTLSNEVSGSKSDESKHENFPSNRDPTSSTSDRGEGSVFGSATGAVFENQGRKTDADGMNDSLFPCETSGLDQNVTDSSFLTLHDTLADISAIPSCSQTLSTSQVSSASTADESHHESSVFTPGRDNEPSSSQISDESAAGVVIPGGKLSGSDSGSSSSSPNANPEGAADDDDDSDLDLELGNWTPELPSGPMGWLQRQMLAGVNPRSILHRMLPSSVSLPDDMDEFELWSLILDYFKMLQEPQRKKLGHINTLGDALRLLQTSNRILVLTGAGVSVSCGIPDFRSRDGVYARLAVDFPDLPDPQAMFDIHYFKRDPRPFFKFAKEIYPGQFRPSTSHKFISLLEHHGKLLRNYTQNIDTLEQVAGISRVVQCHGSFATAKCTNCSYKVNADAIREDIFNQVVPLCPKCPQGTEVLSVMKPEIVFFGEGLPNEFYHSLEDDKERTDLLIVIGSSLKVRPVATIPNMIPPNIPQILINREPLRHMTFDIELLGDGDVIINELCRRLGDGWSHICHTDVELQETTEMPESPGTVAEKQAKMEFENAPTPPVINQDSNSNQPAPSDPVSHPAEAPAINIADGVSSSSDAACKKTQRDADTNEAEPAKDKMTTELGKSTDMKQDGDVPLEKEKSSVDNPSQTSDDTSVPSTSSNAAEEQPSQVKNDTVEQHMADVQSKIESSETKESLPSNTKESSCKNNTSGLGNQLSESNAAGTAEPSTDRTKVEPSTDCTKVELSTSGSSEVTGDEGGSSSEPGQAKNEAEQPEKNRRRSSIGTYLLPSTFLFFPPNRYIFHGAEVYPPSSPECSDDEGEEEPNGPQLDSSSDFLGLDNINPSNLNSSGDLSDPFDPDPSHLSTTPQQAASSANEALSSDLHANSTEQGLEQGSSLMSSTELNEALGDDSHIPLPPLVLSDAVEAILPTVDNVESSNVNGNHSAASDAETLMHPQHHNHVAGSSTHHHPHPHPQPGGTSPDADFEFHVRYKHERDEMFTNSETAMENYEHRIDMSLPNISSSDMV